MFLHRAQDHGDSVFKCPLYEHFSTKREAVVTWHARKKQQGGGEGRGDGEGGQRGGRGRGDREGTEGYSSTTNWSNNAPQLMLHIWHHKQFTSFMNLGISSGSDQREH